MQDTAVSKLIDIYTQSSRLLFTLSLALIAAHVAIHQSQIASEVETLPLWLIIPLILSAGVSFFTHSAIIDIISDKADDLVCNDISSSKAKYFMTAQFASIGVYFALLYVVMTN